ncbi:hypothetical protein ACJJIF_07115 [Microbulbifer sp. SSSA002]|uniref:hypothetical protein n=1 Tax=Microbulbifer sp. SSSA002 TaxID=3243376 RepID=UPI0040395903
MSTTQVEKHLSLLGMRCQDKVTGLKGVIVNIGFDLYGCVQAIVHPGLSADGKPQETIWFDISRLEITSKKSVMERPNFEYGHIAEGRKGPSEKPPESKY